MIRESSLIILEVYKFLNADDAYNAIQTKKLGVKVNPNFLISNDKLKEIKEQTLKSRLGAFFTKAKQLGINDPTYGVQFLISHSSNIDELSSAINDDALYTYLQNYKKPWVKQLPSYNDFINKSFDANNWHKLEKEIQENLDKHGKANKGSGAQNDVKILYPKDANGWELKIPLSFAGSKAAAFYGKEGEKEKPTHWCTRADEYYYNHYTNNNSHPLYIIRNYKTGKAYQIVGNKSLEDDGIVVDFLDQDDVKGDKITHGDLTEIPDSLLKLIKIDNKTLLDYKEEKGVDPNEGAKGYADSTKTIWKEPQEVSKEVLDKAPGSYLRYSFIKKLGPVMKQSTKGGTKAVVLNRWGRDDISNYYSGRGKIINKWREKAFYTRYFFKNKPDSYVEFMNGKYIKFTGDDEIEEENIIKEILERVGLADGTKRFKLSNDEYSTREAVKEKENFNSFNKKHDALFKFADKKVKQEIGDKYSIKMEIWPVKNSHQAYINSFSLVENGKRILSYTFKGNNSYKKTDSLAGADIENKFLNIMKSTNRYYRQLFANDILNARKNKEFKVNGVYEGADMNIVQMELLSEGFKREDILEEGVKDTIVKKVVPILVAAGVLGGELAVGAKALKNTSDKVVAIEKQVSNPSYVSGIYSFELNGHKYTYNEAAKTVTVDGKTRKMGTSDKAAVKQVKRHSDGYFNY